MVPGSDWSHPDLDSWPGTCLILTRTGLILTRTGAMRPGRSLKYPPLRDRSLKEPTGRRRRRLLLRRSASLACGALAIQTDCPGPVSERPAGPWLAVDLRAPHPVPPGPRIPLPGRPGWPLPGPVGCLSGPRPWLINSSRTVFSWPYQKCSFIQVKLSSQVSHPCNAGRGLRLQNQPPITETFSLSEDKQII